MYSVIVVLNSSCFYSYLALSFQSVGHRAYCKVQFSEHAYKPCNAGGQKFGGEASRAVLACFHQELLVKA